MVGQTDSPNTPKTQLARFAASASLKRVHFSPRNEEFYNGMMPQSSPTRAQKRPRSRGILKPTTVNPESNPQLFSSDIDGCDPYNEHSLLEHLSPPPDTTDVSGLPQVMNSRNSAAARVLFSPGIASPDSNSIDKKRQSASIPSGQIFKEAVSKLRDMSSTDTETIQKLAGVYNDIYEAVVKGSDETAVAEEYTEYVTGLLDCLDRDINSSKRIPRYALVVAIKCLGCASHADKLFGISRDGSRFSALFKQMCAKALKEYPEEKSVCMAVVACICVQRVSVTSIQPAVPDMIGFCIHAMKALDRSVTLVFQCLTAIETLLRRVPVATRSLSHTWLFPVLCHIVSPTPGVRSKADDIIRQNIPWVSADAHSQEMGKTVSMFLETQHDDFLGSCERLLERGESQAVARIWGMLVTICARQYRARMSAILQIMQKCFNSDDTDVLVTALMQWRCLIYAFLVQTQLERHKCVKLVMTPIMSLLASEKTSDKVRLASVRCWATLVYALGENIGSHIDIVTSVADAAATDSCLDVRETIARVLASLLNRIVLPEEQIARFVIPKMVIGTTTLAASDGKALSTTRGPFSSDSEYLGDHTETLCRYVIGISADSPVKPVLTDAIVKFIPRYAFIQDDESNDGSGQPCFEAFSQLCKTTAFVLDYQSTAVLADSLLQAFDLRKEPTHLETQGLEHFVRSPMPILFETLIHQLDSITSATRYNGDWVTNSVLHRPVATYKQVVAARYLTLLLGLLYKPSEAISKDAVLNVQQRIKKCASSILASHPVSGPVASGYVHLSMVDVVEAALIRYCPSKAQNPAFGEAVDVVMECISEHATNSTSHTESILSGETLFKSLSYFNDILLRCSQKSRMTIYASCWEMCSKDGFWNIALSSVNKWVQHRSMTGLKKLELIAAICTGQKVHIGAEERHCKAFLYTVIEWMRVSAVGKPGFEAFYQMDNLHAGSTCEEIESIGISAMTSFCLVKEELRQLDVHCTVLLERVFCAIARVLCFSCGSLDTDRASTTCIPFDGEPESVDTVIAHSKRLSERTKNENTRTELLYAVGVLTFLEKLRSPEDIVIIPNRRDGSGDHRAAVARCPAEFELSLGDEEEEEARADGDREESCHEKHSNQNNKLRTEKTAMQQLQKTLGQLESELNSSADLEIDDLLTVQERMCGIQQRLCKLIKKNHHQTVKF